MKHIVLAALLAAIAVPAVQAQVHQPTSGATYICDYTNPTMNETDPGWSVFTLTAYNGGTLLRGIEDFQANNQWHRDNRRVNFYEPFDRYSPTDPTRVVATRWTFDFGNGAPTCQVWASSLGRYLSFFNCSDGSSRSCTRSY
ncbi:MAG TPA: hypothetical protein VH394_20925 [Thermoanaerobaculia bacterium]|jgi:hypothetical protein|nr:hypothetical protein [Thermoanaerobaculia bacterium]